MSTFFWNQYVLMETQQKMYGTTYRFREEVAADETSSAPSDPGRSTRQFPSSKHHRYNKSGHKNALT